MYLICMLIALILFVLAAMNVGSPRFALGWAGLAFWVGAEIFGKGLIR